MVTRPRSNGGLLPVATQHRMDPTYTYNMHQWHICKIWYTSAQLIYAAFHWQYALDSFFLCLSDDIPSSSDEYRVSSLLPGSRNCSSRLGQRIQSAVHQTALAFRHGCNWWGWIDKVQKGKQNWVKVHKSALEMMRLHVLQHHQVRMVFLFHLLEGVGQRVL